jgi:phage tail-like protein
MSEYALGLRFHVRIDGQDFGNWEKCEGLSVEYDMHEHSEGGQNTFVHRIPGRVKYQNIKLTRALDGSSPDVTAWMASVALRLVPGTAEISVRDGTGDEVASWSFIGIYPVRWSGPNLDIYGNQHATETLELAHQGFLGL